MMRAAKLEVPLYEEVEADTTATSQALTVVIAVAVATGIGQALGATMANQGTSGLIGGLISGVLTALLGWAVWSYVMYFVGTRVFGGVATYGELLRTTGFAQSPGVLNILRFIPVIGALVALVASIWVIVTSFIGIRQALDLDNTKTVFTILIGIVAYILVAAVVAIIIGVIFGAGMAAGSLLTPGVRP
jgi:hypothetical protein